MTTEDFVQIPVSYMDDKAKIIVHAWLIRWDDGTYSDGGVRSAGEI